MSNLEVIRTVLAFIKEYFLDEWVINLAMVVGQEQLKTAAGLHDIKY